MVAFGAMCTLALLAFPDSFVALVGAPAAVAAPAAQYLQIRALGVPAVFLIAVLGGAFQVGRCKSTTG
jgi:Na+-driven multidrug efflux pump